MRNYAQGVVLALAVGSSCLLWTYAQTGGESKAAPGTVRLSEAPDLSGVWMKDRPAATALQYWVYEFNSEEPPMTAWGEAQYKAAKSSFGAHSFSLAETNDPVYHGCFPPGVPRVFLHPTPLQIVQTPAEVIMLFEYDFMRRQIFIDGRPHDTAFGPTWMGDSIGHWERDTLVVDSLNFNDKTWIDRVGHPHSEALHLIERIRRANQDHLIDDITIEDPKAYAKPWTAHLDFVRKPNWTLAEHFCEDLESFQEIEKQETTPAK